MAVANLFETFNDPSKYGTQIAQTISNIRVAQSVIDAEKIKIGQIEAQIENKLSIYPIEQRKIAEKTARIGVLRDQIASIQKNIKDYEAKKKSYEKILKSLQSSAAAAKKNSEQAASQQNRNTAQLQRNVDGRIDPVKGFPQEVSNIPLSDASNVRLAGSRDKRKPAPLRGSGRRR
jgi:septation ring formation regulator EzrA